MVEDETGFSLVSALKRTWAPCGQTPTVRTSLHHHERLNLMGGLRVSPGGRVIKLMIQARRQSVRGEQVIAWLRGLLGRVHGPIVLLWDHHPIHLRKLVQAFITQHSRLHVYEFPTGAPELNPAEWIWQQINDLLASTAPHNEAELQANLRAAIARIRRSPWRLWAGFSGAKLPLA